MDKRYNSFSGELRRRFGCRVRRVPLDAGLSCPNRDGTSGNSGCIFCSPGGSGSSRISGGSITEQLERGSAAVRRKYADALLLPYFQAFSNTYAPAERLRLLYDEALAFPGVAGLVVGTRPDCLPPEVVELLAEYARRTYFWLEIGLQSPLDRTLSLLQRGHDVATFSDAVARCRRAGIRVCAHIILGLPGESREEMLAGARLMNSLGVEGVKIHLLHVLRDTRLQEMHARGEVPLPSLEEYVAVVADFLELLHPSVVIHRLTGEAPPGELVAPQWSLRKMEVLNAIDEELERRGTRQGSRCSTAEER